MADKGNFWGAIQYLIGVIIAILFGGVVADKIIDVLIPWTGFALVLVLAYVMYDGVSKPNHIFVMNAGLVLGAVFIAAYMWTPVWIVLQTIIHFAVMLSVAIAAMFIAKIVLEILCGKIKVSVMNGKLELSKEV